MAAGSELPFKLVLLLNNNTNQIRDTATEFLQRTTNSDSFQLALQVKERLGISETQDEAVYFNAEYLLYALYPETELFLNPFLSHWVDLAKGGVNSSHGERALLLRIEFVKGILAGHAEKLSYLTPDEFVRRFDEGLRFEVDIGVYSTIMQDQDIEDHPQVNVTDTAEAVPTFEEAISAIERASNKPLRKEDGLLVLSYLENEMALRRSTVQHTLTRLFVDVASMDLINTIVRSETRLIPDPVFLVHGYLENAIRKIEGMTKWGDGGDDETRPDSSEEKYSQTDPQENYGKDEQKRAVDVLTVFIKSVIRSDIVTADELTFELQDLFFRFSWIPAVRSFKTELHKDGWRDSFAQP